MRDDLIFFLLGYIEVTRANIFTNQMAWKVGIWCINALDLYPYVQFSPSV